MINQWQEQLMRCVEGLYVIEEDSREIVWANEYVVEHFSRDCVGKKCWEAFLGRSERCPFCPRLTPKDDIYIWDYYDRTSRRWMKIKNLVFVQDGITYRAGNLNMIDDVMRLNYETVQQISILQTILATKNGEMVNLTREAIYDSLTSLFNRNCFQQDLEREYAGRSGVGVIYFDLNNLKEVNDKYRHAAGDALLVRMAEALHQVSRQFRTIRCYRIGGDEFVILAPCKAATELEQVEMLFRSCLERLNYGQPYQCSVAIGSAFSAEICDPEVLVSKADHAMYLCKQKMKAAAAQLETSEENLV